MDKITYKQFINLHKTLTERFHLSRWRQFTYKGIRFLEISLDDIKDDYYVTDYYPQDNILILLDE